MNSIVNDWKDAFDCRDKKTSKPPTPDNIDENIYYNCSKNVTVISLLNTDRGHTWPGTNYDSAGFCRTDKQTEINIQACKNLQNDWGNDFLLERLFKKL
jgi:poly(3-hydroxybutyrate) depolymerase